MDLSGFIPIEGYNGKYLVNINGDVYSTYKKGFLKPNLYHGYWRVILFSSNPRHLTSFYVHRLVATYFIPNPNNYKYVNHKDENKLNNSVENLEWCTQSYNCTYNDAAKKRGATIRETMRRNGGPWNKGKKGSMSAETRRKISEAMKGKKVKFFGNQYVDANGNPRH